MIKKITRVIEKFIEFNQFPLLLFFCSFFLLITFSGTRLFFSDEGIILNQFYNLIHGSLPLKIAKIDTARGILITVGDNLYGAFSYSLLILSLPTFYLLKVIESLYGAHLFIVQIWALCGGIIVYLLALNRKFKHTIFYGTIAYFLLIFSNLYYFKPIYFPKWGELLSIELTNIFITSLLILVVFLLFRKLFGQRISMFASFFVLFATPLSFYAITLKHHSLTIFLTLLAFYFFYRYYEQREDKFLYVAYISSGLCVWTRPLDGAVLLTSLVIADIFISRRSIKHLVSIFIVILISLLPFFMFNYLILGDPFSLAENTPLSDKITVLVTAKDYISLEGTRSNIRQVELLNELGYVWAGNIKGYWSEILGYTLFFKLINTFGVFLVSPFLILAIAFIISIIKRNIKLNAVDKFLGLYVLILFGVYFILYKFFNKNALMSLITDTPMELEYRYLLILYGILLYFALRIDRVKEILEKKSGTIIQLYGILLLIFILYFITGFPIKFITIYYYISIILSSSLFLVMTTYLQGKEGIRTGDFQEKVLLFLISFSIAQATAFLLFYYWAVTISYISPSQNFAIIPILNYIIEWMYQSIIY
ncbi:MAG TPA: glycosyltransferase family 39 protein [Candidatus Limnocylindrales bacterium]|nr:glycosyltransferase family 39 protein [Candidatus Limnocylindrales bacterium]